MYTGFLSLRFSRQKDLKFCVLIAVWLAGLLGGVLLAKAYRINLAYITVSLSKPAVPFLVFLTNGIPLTIAAFALYHSFHIILFPLLFLQGGCRTFCATLAMMTGSAGWLIRLLFSFSGCCTSLLIWWITVRHLTERGNRFYQDVYFVAMLSCVVSLAEIFLISPLLANLSIYF